MTSPATHTVRPYLFLFFFDSGVHINTAGTQCAINRLLAKNSACLNKFNFNSWTVTWCVWSKFSQNCESQLLEISSVLIYFPWNECKMVVEVYENFNHWEVLQGISVWCIFKLHPSQFMILDTRNFNSMNFKTSICDRRTSKIIS